MCTLEQGLDRVNCVRMNPRLTIFKLTYIIADSYFVLCYKLWLMWELNVYDECDQLMQSGLHSSAL